MSVKDDIRAGRARLQAIVTEQDQITNAGVWGSDGSLHLPAEAKARFMQLGAEAKDARGLLEVLEGNVEMKSLLDGSSGGGDGGAGRRAAGGLSVPEFKSLGQAFVESAEFKSREGSRMHEDFIVDGDLGGLYRPRGDGDAEFKDIFTGVGGTQTRYTFGQTEQLPILPRLQRTARVRDLFPVASTQAALIQYVRVMGFAGGVNAARPVPERETVNGTQVFGLKPHTSLEFLPAEAPVRTIAHYEVAHRNILDDEPQLRSVIDTELLYGLRLAEDDQLLNGDGQGENILGILKTPGVQQYPGTGTPSPVQPTDTYLDAIRRAATRVWLANYEPTGIVVHPFDWERMELTKDANGNYIAAVSVTSGAERRLWQIPVTSSPAMVEGKALIGAFGLGAKIYDRQQSNIRVSDQHADYFIRNAVLVLAEERVGLVVPRPESFVTVDLENAVPGA